MDSSKAGERCLLLLRVYGLGFRWFRRFGSGQAWDLECWYVRFPETLNQQDRVSITKQRVWWNIQCNETGTMRAYDTYI